jgi:hypothetical protein
MNINPRLFVEIVPLEAPSAPVPHPVRQARFDVNFVYKALGMYNASETSECYFILANPDREIWFIPQRHLRAYKLINSDEFFLPKARASSADGKGPLRGRVNGGCGHPGTDAADRDKKPSTISLQTPGTINGS